MALIVLTKHNIVKSSLKILTNYFQKECCSLPEVVLVSLLDHGDHDHEEEGEQPRLGGDGGVYDPGEDQSHLGTDNMRAVK